MVMNRTCSCGSANSPVNFVVTVTTQFRGVFREDQNEQLRFTSMVRGIQR